MKYDSAESFRKHVCITFRILSLSDRPSLNRWEAPRRRWNRLFIGESIDQSLALGWLFSETREQPLGPGSLIPPLLTSRSTAPQCVVRCEHERVISLTMMSLNVCLLVIVLSSSDEALDLDIYMNSVENKFQHKENYIQLTNCL